MHLNFTIKSGFFNEIDYWTWGDFRKHFRHGGQRKKHRKKSPWAFVKETQWSKTCSTVKSTWQAKHRGRYAYGGSPPITFRCIYVGASVSELVWHETFAPAQPWSEPPIGYTMAIYRCWGRTHIALPHSVRTTHDHLVTCAYIQQCSSRNI